MILPSRSVQSFLLHVLHFQSNAYCNTVENDRSVSQVATAVGNFAYESRARRTRNQLYQTIDIELADDMSNCISHSEPENGTDRIRMENRDVHDILDIVLLSPGYWYRESN